MTKPFHIVALGLGMALLAGVSGLLADSAGFQQIFKAGTLDPNGKFMGGTEVFTLVRHGGKLWALAGYPYDQPGNDPTPGSQVLVLDRPGGSWRMDYEFGKTKWRASLDSFTFTTDGQGRKLDPPVSVLIAAPSDFQGEIVLHSRDDAKGTWAAMPLAKSPKIASVRSLGLHRDRVTGVHRIFAGVLPNGLYSGVYDPQAPGRIRWDAEPEFTGYNERPMSFAECNGVLYMAAKPHLFRRIDGERPRWETVYTIPGAIHKNSYGLRGLTAIPNPSGPGEVLLAALEGNPAWIIRLDPAKGFESTLEVDLINFVEQQWGRRPSWVTAPHNDLTPVVDPKTGRTVHLIGSALSFAPPAGTYPQKGWDRGAWYLIRHEGGRYEMRRIVVSGPDPELIATRSIVASPFGEAVLYFGGYNPNGAPAHNTGWVYAAPLATALGPQIPIPVGPARVSIMEIQGKGPFSPLKGQVLETSGVVTLVTSKKDGFWIQDPQGDGDPATSDGLFVFGFPSLVVPSPGDRIEILGRVEEEQKGNELPRTRLVAVQSPKVLSRQAPLPEPVVLTKLPDVSMSEGIAFWEALEGMRVRVDDAPVISPTNRFREFDLLAPGNAVPGSGYYPQSGRLLIRSLGGDQVDYAPERIMVGDATQEKPAVVSAGDRVASLVGVVDYTFGYYKVQPESLQVATREIPKPPVSVRTGPAGNFVIATYNLWDFFDAVVRPIDERYSLKPDEFDKRVTKVAQSIVTELKLPQVIAVQEAEGSAIDALAERLNALAGTHYQTAWRETSDWRGLSMGFLYDPARVKLQSLTQLSGPEVEEHFGRKSAVGNREPLVGVFEAGPGIPPITVICNKLKTKRAEESPFSVEPPFRFTELQRKPQTWVIRQYLNSLFEKDSNAYVVVTGDLGGYDFAEPGEGKDYALGILKGTSGEVPMTNLVNREDESERYDYLFQGAGVLVSHMLVSPALLKTVAGADILHFNTPFPEGIKWDASTTIRASDRDPIEARFQLGTGR